ncbi:MAG: hypothetical protein CMK07_09355 [Ponticaulis sp.]|nr:hypothetical protein [Ponticaulis sp.]
MSFRRILFWSHLAAGLVVGVFVLIMSVTGIALMYENSIVLAVNDSVKVEAPENTAPMTADELAQAQTVLDAGDRGVSLNWDNRENAPIMVRAGRSTPISISPYTAEIVENPSWAVDDAFHFLMEIHRWLAAEGEARSTARAITGAANLAFLFLLLSGLYLWIPKAWRWVFLKNNLFMRKSYPTGKARDFNWHHVFSIWASIPLFFIIISGVMISYPWAGQLIYTVWGEERPQRGGPSGDEVTETVDLSELASFQDGFEAVQAFGDRKWTRITLSLPSDPAATTLSFQRHYGDRIIPQQRVSMTYDRATQEIVDVRTYADNSPATKTRMFLRFAHTGERFGLIGSTIAGLASLAACFLVYTGFALSYRRLIRPLFRKKPTA